MNINKRENEESNVGGTIKRQRQSHVDRKEATGDALAVITESGNLVEEFNGEVGVEEVFADNDDKLSGHCENVQYEDDKVDDRKVQYTEDVIVESVRYDGELVVELMSDLAHENASNDGTINVSGHDDFDTVNGVLGMVNGELDTVNVDLDTVSSDLGTVNDHLDTVNGDLVSVVTVPEDRTDCGFEIEPDEITILISEDGNILEGDVAEEGEEVRHKDEESNEQMVREDEHIQNDFINFTNDVETDKDDDVVVDDDENIVIIHMDINNPLSTLRRLLELKLHCSLANHEFWLQDSVQLDPTKNLVSQCVQGSGIVQINVEVKSFPDVISRVNIVDILIPAEEMDELSDVTSDNHVEQDNVSRWIVDQQFRKEQERLKIPTDPFSWSVSHIKHWIQWAVKKFNLTGVDVKNFNLTGQQLTNLSHEEFVKFIPSDSNDIFWTHLELLRKCKFVAVMQPPQPLTTVFMLSPSTGSLCGRQNKTKTSRSITIPSSGLTPGNRTGNNGQTQLWQFLLELLTDKDYRDIIQWLGDDGQFKLVNPELVAQLWGQRKNKPTMNYEKLSRALRYYYDGDMIAKVHGKRFVYKFVCDLRTLLGYSAAELNQQVAESANRTKRQRITI